MPIKFMLSTRSTTSGGMAKPQTNFGIPGPLDYERVQANFTFHTRKHTPTTRLPQLSFACVLTQTCVMV